MNASPERTAGISSWVGVIVVVGALLMATGAILALFDPVMLVAPHDTINGAVRIYAGYLASRNMAMAVLLIVLLCLRARHSLANLMVLVAFVQVLDAGVDCFEGRWMIAPGVLLLGLVFIAGARRISGYPFWRIEAWEG
jgi:hypothetical protein